MKLKITADYELQVDGVNTTWPGLKQLKPYLPRPLRRNATHIATEMDEHTITKEEALRAYYTYKWHRDRITNNRDGGMTLESNHPGSVFLAFGETMYELHPVKSINNSKALGLARHKAMTVAKAESGHIMELAKSEAKNVRSEARQTVSRAQQLLRQHTDATRNDHAVGKLNILPPRHECKLYNIGDCDNSQFILSIPVTNLTIKIDSWNKGTFVKKLDVPFRTHVNVEMSYLWANGAWDLRPQSCRLAQAQGRHNVALMELPHISKTSACFTLGTRPTNPASFEEVYAVAVAMLSAMSCVNFDSLLSVHVSNWPEGLRTNLGDLIIEENGAPVISWARMEQYVTEGGQPSPTERERVPDTSSSFHITGSPRDSTV